jgi:hypothetical protein
MQSCSHASSRGERRKQKKGGGRGRGTDADADADADAEEEAEAEAEVVSVCPLALHTLRFEFLSRVGIFSPPSLPRDVL